MSATVITIFKNGDRHFPGKKVVVNRKEIRNFETFLDRVTRDTCSRIAIRKIYTPTHGTFVRPKLDNLVHGATYVAAGVEKFRLAHYGHHEISKPLRTSQLKVKPQLRRIVSSRYQKEATAAPLRNRIIFVSRNGETDRKPLKLLLDKRMLESMEAILQHLSSKLKLTTGAVGCLHSVDGKKIMKPNLLTTNTHYVAVGYGKNFTPADYLHEKFSPASRKRNILHKKYRGTFVGLTRQRRHNKENELPPWNPNDIDSREEFITGFNKISHNDKRGLEESVDVNEKTDQPELKKWEISTTYLPENEELIPFTEESFNTTDLLDQMNTAGDAGDTIPSKLAENFPVSVTRTPSPAGAPAEDTQKDEGGEPEQPNEDSVFKATGNQRESAEEVTDDAKTRVEKTIDMLPAATVVEELDS